MSTHNNICKPFKYIIIFLCVPQETSSVPIIRSQFEHCSPIRRPNNKIMMNKLENLQKKCIKWILSEEYFSYSTYDLYLHKCRQVRLLPLAKRFDLNDLVLFYKIVNKMLPIHLPNYLNFYEGNSRLRSCHLDHLSIVSNLKPKTSLISDTNKNCALNKSFFYRVHLIWNQLPLINIPLINIRSIIILSKFRAEILKYLTLPDTQDDHDHDQKNLSELLFELL